MITPEQELETKLREQLAEIHRRAQAEAAPIIDRLAKIEAMKPRPPLIYADLIPALAAKGHVSKVMEDLAAMIDDAKGQVDRVTGVRDAIFNGHAITRTWTDEEGKLTSERIDPKDFYAKPEGAGDA